MINKQAGIIERQSARLLNAKDKLNALTKEVNGPISIYELMGIGDRLQSILNIVK